VRKMAQSLYSAKFLRRPLACWLLPVSDDVCAHDVQCMYVGHTRRVWRQVPVVDGIHCRQLPSSSAVVRVDVQRHDRRAQNRHRQWQIVSAARSRRVGAHAHADVCEVVAHVALCRCRIVRHASPKCWRVRCRSPNVSSVCATRNRCVRACMLYAQTLTDVRMLVGL
jgi:hypothetical protein